MRKPLSVGKLSAKSSPLKEFQRRIGPRDQFANENQSSHQDWRLWWMKTMWKMKMKMKLMVCDNARQLPGTTITLSQGTSNVTFWVSELTPIFYNIYNNFLC